MIYRENPKQRYDPHNDIHKGYLRVVQVQVISQIIYQYSEKNRLCQNCKYKRNR